MQIERNRRNGSYSHLLSNGTVDGGGDRIRKVESSLISPSSSYSVAASSAGSPAVVKYIEHRVSRMDTLAGVAIKYGVEVADIKRLNGLVTDLQMFAHKFIQIPLPGRHPPSPILANGSSCNGEKTPPRRHRGDVLELFESLKLKPPQRRVSPAMTTLQGYYGLEPPKRRSPAAAEGTEMAVYGTTARALYLEDGPMPGKSPVSDPPTRHRKSRSLVNGFLAENGKLAEEGIVVSEAGDGSEAYNDKSVRRRPKTDTEPLGPTPELLLKEEIGGAFSGRTGKGLLALRPKSGSRTDLDAAHINAVPDGLAAVRKSSSTSNLQESDNSSSSIWGATSMWNLKPESIARPIFDGLPKPMAVRRNKAALD